VLGEGAIALHRAACALDSLRSRLTAYGAGFFGTEQRARPYEDLERLGQEMGTLSERFTVELGREHEAVAAFTGARVAVRDIVATLALLRDPDRHGVSDIQKFADETIEQIEDQRAGFDAWRDRFMDALRDARGKE